MPSIFAVAPKGKMKLALARSTPSSFSAAIIETGSVVALEEVSNAVNNGCRILLMKVKGDMPDTSHTIVGSTNNP